jgi:hypothetical protein
MTGIKSTLNKGSITRREIVVVKYGAGEAPTMSVSLERPYEVTATAQTTGIETYNIENKSGTVRGSPQVKASGVVEGLRLAYNAFTNRDKTNGITEADVTGVENIVDEHNGNYSIWDKVTGGKLKRLFGNSNRTILVSEEREMNVDGLSDRELSDLL